MKLPACLIWFVGGVSAVVGLPETAAACSGLPCAEVVQLVLPISQTVPASFGALTSYDTLGPMPRTAAASVRMWDAADPQELLFSGDINGAPLPITPSLLEGHEYVVELTPKCWYATTPTAQERRLKVGAEAPVPTTLGPLSIVNSGPAQVPVAGGAGCYSAVDGSVVDMKLDLENVPEAWRETLTGFQLMVDGAPFDWPLTMGGFGPSVGGSNADSTARGSYVARPTTFRAWTSCSAQPSSSEMSSDPALPPGKHTVWVRAQVPTRDLPYVESERLEITLQCTPPAANDEGCSVTSTRARTGAASWLLTLCAALGARRRKRAFAD